MPAAATVADVRAFFASSTSHHVALLTDGERYVGAIEAGRSLTTSTPPGRPPSHVIAGPTIAPDVTATQARDIAIAEPSLRLPVVDDAGALVGIVAVTSGRDGFCGT